MMLRLQPQLDHCHPVIRRRQKLVHLAQRRLQRLGAALVVFFLHETGVVEHERDEEMEGGWTEYGKE